jgi:hypothetical protein
MFQMLMERIDYAEICLKMSDVDYKFNIYLHYAYISHNNHTYGIILNN